MRLHDWISAMVYKWGRPPQMVLLQTNFTVTLHSLLSQTVILLLLVHHCWPLVQCAGEQRVLSELNMVPSATLEGCKELSLTTAAMLDISWHRENMGEIWGCARETAVGMTQQQYVFLWKVLPILSHCSIAACSNSIDQYARFHLHYTIHCRFVLHVHPYTYLTWSVA